MRSRTTGVALALLVMTACTSGGGAGTPEPTATGTPAQSTASNELSTTAMAATFVIREPDESGPGITVTTPASGWSLDTDVGGVFKGDVDAAVGEAAVFLWSFPAGTEFYVPKDPCQSESTLPVTPAITPDEISSALAAQALRDASEPVGVTIDGYAGNSLTLHVPVDVMFADCEGGTFLTYATGEDPGARTQQGPSQADEIWILDVDGNIVIISAVYRPDTPADLVEEMRNIAQSATFQFPG